MDTKDFKTNDDQKQGLILAELRAWRCAHPDATLYEMARERMKRMAELQAHILEGLSKELLPAEKEILGKAPQCPECGIKM